MEQSLKTRMKSFKGPRMKAVVVILAVLVAASSADESGDHQHQVHPNWRSFFYAPPGFFNPYSPYEVPGAAGPDVPVFADPMSPPQSSFQDVEDEMKAQEQLAELKRIYAQQEMTSDDHQRLLLPSITYVGHSVTLSTSSFIALLKRLASSFTVKTVTVLVPVMTTIQVTETVTATPTLIVASLPVEETTEPDSATETSF